jgi:hypothetical protein
MLMVGAGGGGGKEGDCTDRKSPAEIWTVPRGGAEAFDAWAGGSLISCSGKLASGF